MLNLQHGKEVPLIMERSEKTVLSNTTNENNISFNNAVFLQSIHVGLADRTKINKVLREARRSGASVSYKRRSRLLSTDYFSIDIIGELASVEKARDEIRKLNH